MTSEFGLTGAQQASAGCSTTASGCRPADNRSSCRGVTLLAELLPAYQLESDLLICPLEWTGNSTKFDRRRAGRICLAGVAAGRRRSDGRAASRGIRRCVAARIEPASAANGVRVVRHRAPLFASRRRQRRVGSERRGPRGGRTLVVAAVLGLTTAMMLSGRSAARRFRRQQDAVSAAEELIQLRQTGRGFGDLGRRALGAGQDDQPAGEGAGRAVDRALASATVRRSGRLANRAARRRRR